VLIIRDAQMAVLDEHMRRSFEERAVAHLSRIRPAAVPPEQVRPVVWAGIARAAGYGIRVERDLVLYLELLVRVGADFDLREEHAWARRLLQSPALLPAARVRLVYDRLVEDAGG
jgi:hypothetical protein